uniref:Uncharacterized protein n=1 Tax=Rhizophora mucronata TaxID=61149 RepID=A0A2P2LSB7_RHIMU
MEGDEMEPTNMAAGTDGIIDSKNRSKRTQRRNQGGRRNRFRQLFRTGGPVLRRFLLHRRQLLARRHISLSSPQLIALLILVSPTRLRRTVRPIPRATARELQSRPQHFQPFQKLLK